MNNAKILSLINEKLSAAFRDYKEMYFFGSRMSEDYSDESDFDIVLVFDFLDYKKQLEIAGVISELEYQLNIYIDCKLLTSSGTRSIDYIRQNLNPLFIKNAIDNGIYYARV